MSAASATVNRGELNAIALDSTSGRRATAPKLKNIPAMLSTPLPACPSGRLGAHDSCEFTPPGVDKHDRNDREYRAVKHHLSDGIARAEMADQRLHHREQRRGNYLESDASGGVHQRDARPDLFRWSTMRKTMMLGMVCRD